MLKKRLLIAGAFLLVAVVTLALVLTNKSQDANSSATTSSTTDASSNASSLPKENLELLGKLNNSSEAERLQALAPYVRENEAVKTSLMSNDAKVQFLAETFRVHELHATIDAQLTGISTKRVTYILLPSDGQWRIANQGK